MSNVNDFSIFGPKLLTDLEYMQYALVAKGQTPGQALDQVEAVIVTLSGVVDTKEGFVQRFETLREIITKDMRRLL